MQLTVNALHGDFRRLAAARKIMGASKDVQDLAADRTSAERWIARFASGSSVENPVSAGSHAKTFHPQALADASEGPMRVFYIHGGGMVYYSTATFSPLLQFISNELGTTVEAFDYLKMPEHEIADSIKQLLADIVATIENGDSRPILLAGDSVGGLLALYIATRLLPQRFSHLLLLYPVLDLHQERQSYHDYGAGYFLDTWAMRRFKSFLQPYFMQHSFDPFNLHGTDMQAILPCTLVSAGCDVLLDEGLAWLALMRANSVSVKHVQFNDLPHDFCLYFGKLQVARQAVQEILSVLKPT